MFQKISSFQICIPVPLPVNLSLSKVQVTRQSVRELLGDSTKDVVFTRTFIARQEREGKSRRVLSYRFHGEYSDNKFRKLTRSFFFEIDYA